MNNKIKTSLNKSFENLFDDVRRTKKQNRVIKDTVIAIVDNVAKKNGMAELKWIGSTKTNLSVNYKDKGYDVDAILIWNEKTKEELVDIKFLLVEEFRKFCKAKYDEVKIHNKKPVISIRFLNKSGNDRFHTDLAVATQNNNGQIKFIYSEKPNEKDQYKIYSNESVEMAEHFINQIEKNSEKQKSIVTLKWWNDNKTRNLAKDVRLPSSLISEKIAISSENSIIDLNVNALKEFEKDLENGTSNSSFEPKWNYLRKMNKEQRKELKGVVCNLIDAFDEALRKDSIVDAINLLKEFFDGLKLVDDKEAETNETSGRAG